jgi:hypothetical protein
MGGLGATVVLFGGWNDEIVTLGDTWVWDGSDWTEAMPATSPSARVGGCMATLGDKVVLWGGFDRDGNVLADTWLWDGGDWTQVVTPASPPASATAQSAALGDHVVLLNFNPYKNEGLQTWLFDGSTWSLAPGSESSPSVLGYGVATTGDRVLVAGGAPAAVENEPNLDTYAWDGTVWTNLGPSQALAGPWTAQGTVMAPFTP